MNNSDFDLNNNGAESAEPNEAEKTAETEELSQTVEENTSVEENMTAENGELEAQSKSAEPQWYGVSYTDAWNNNPAVHLNGETAQPVKKKKLSKQILLVAVCLLLCISLCCVSVIGTLMYLSNNGTLNNNSNGGNNYTDNGKTGDKNTSGNGFSNDYYRTSDTDYNYGGTVISKNDGSSLSGSVNGSAGENKKSIMEVAAMVKDSVVEITTTTSYRGSISAGAGSGVIVHADGIIVTNNHVIADVDTIYVRLTNGSTYEAILRGTDEEADIAVLKIEPKETLTVAKLGYSGALALGEEVIAIGNPLGELGGTVTNGIISSLQREVEVEDVTMTLLQTNAAINAGNSGGGLFNLAGELVGIVNAKYSASGVEGLGFAIPIDTAADSINKLLQYGYIPGRAALGVTIQEMNVRTGYFTVQQVLYVYSASEDSALKKGDYIFEVDGNEINTISALKKILRQHQVGDTLEVLVYRDQQEKTVTVTLVEDVPAQTTVNFDN